VLVVLVALAAVIATVAARVAASAPARHAGFSAALACGLDRWPIKTLKDRPNLLRARGSTIAHLGRLPRPTPFPPPGRLLLEHQIYTVVAQVTAILPQADRDDHLYLRSGRFRMIAETPPALYGGCDREPPHADDYQYRLRGAVLNAIELHPVLGFDCLSGS
jgi:hypothetical protein